LSFHLISSLHNPRLIDPQSTLIQVGAYGPNRCEQMFFKNVTRNIITISVHLKV